MRSAIALAVSLCCSHVAFADLTGPEILAKVDHGLNSFNDGTFEAKLLVKQSDGTAREYGFTTFQKRPDKRLVRFTAPGDVKGMGVLIENAETMYVYLPGFQRIRRMGTHIRNQTFMGSDFGFDDMAVLAFSPHWDATISAQDDKTYTLELKPKKPKDEEIGKMIMSVDKVHFNLLKIEYYDQAGKKQKTQIRDEYKQDGPDHWQPGRVAIIDHRRNDHTSEIRFSSSKLDTGLPDDLFSQRSLIRGN